MGKFISQRGMREARHSENVIRSIHKRQGKKVLGVRHLGCSCSCRECVGPILPILEEEKK